MANAAGEPAISQKPTRVRYGVLGFACALSMVTYLDRVCISSGQSAIIRELHLESEADLKWVFTAFALAYALFEVPSGWLGDVFGPRNVLIRIVLWWSAFTALTGTIGMEVGGYVLGGVGTLVVVRFLFGMGEAGAYPNITRALHNWFPYRERGLAQGAVWMSGRLMGGLTPIIWTLLVAGVTYTISLKYGETTELRSGESVTLQNDETVQLRSGKTISLEKGKPTTLADGATITADTADSGVRIAEPITRPVLDWRATFWVFGLLGVGWCFLFALWFRNRPEEKRGVNAAELALIRTSAAESKAAHAAIPWKRLLASRNLWLLCLMYFCQAYGWYFYITYLPRFMEQQHVVAETSLLGAVYKGGPLWLGAVGCLMGGYLTDWFIRRTGNRRLGRSLFGMAGHALTGLCFLALYLIGSPDPESRPDPFWFFLVISLAGFFTDLTMGPAWATCQDIGKRYAAIVAGCMNMIGNLGGAVATWVSGFVLQQFLDAYASGLAAHLNVGVGQIAKLPEAEKNAVLMYGYQLNFLIYAAIYVVGVICWSQIDATKPIAPEEEEHLPLAA